MSAEIERWQVVTARAMSHGTIVAAGNAVAAALKARDQRIAELEAWAWEMAQYDTWYGRQARGLLGNP